MQPKKGKTRKTTQRRTTKGRARKSNSSNARARGRPPKDWQVRFLAALRTLPVVRAACEMAQVERSTAYKARNTDAKFAAAWREALEDGYDRAEQEVFRRGLAGWDEPVYGATRTEEGKPGGTAKVGVIRRYDSNLLLRALEAGRPEKWGRKLEVRREDSEIDAEIRKLSEELAAQARNEAAEAPPKE